MATKVGLLHLDLLVDDAMSLKDKRRVIKSFKDRLGHSRNVSVAEVGHLDSIRRAVLAVAMVSNDSRYVAGAMEQIVNLARNNRAWVLLNHEVELI